MFPRNDDPRYFSLAGFAAIVARAAVLGYRIGPFRDFVPPKDRPALILRHDLDGPLRGAQAIAEIEAEAGVRATFFVQTAGDVYNLLSAKNRALLRRLTDLGHEIGLHYESARYAADAAAVVSDLRLLEDLSHQPIRSAAQHIPIDSAPFPIGRYVENDAYATRFTSDPLTYISDSLMAWRQATPHDLLDKRASFQLLVHPETWVGAYRDIGEALQGMRDDEIARIAARYDDLAVYYAQLFERRADADARFRAARSREPDGGA
jgi:hypothetical protein